MPTDCIPFKDTNYFSPLICDYLDEKPHLKPFYNRFPHLDNFKSQIEEKARSFNAHSRAVLVKSLKTQYKNIEISENTDQNIEYLAKDNTFTITTGHQLNLFTGPLYFFYKIISTINLCKELSTTFADYNFVPIYWMASEDHDFNEINYFNFKGKKIQWNRNSSGAVGELDLNGLDHIYEVFATQLDNTKNAQTLKQLFKTAYLEHENLTDATRFLVNELFAEYGLVILDGNDVALKRSFAPYMEKELITQRAYQVVSETNNQISALSKSYKIQVTPREINLFYIKDSMRERIIFENDTYSVLNSNISWSKSEILKHLDEVPERFSPNVITRPLYQEVILPNLCYIGGGGELAYWLQLKNNFDANRVTFPMLLLRNSVLLMTSKQKEKLDKLKLSVENLFLDQNSLITKVIKDVSDIQIDFTPQKSYLKKQFEDLYELAKQTDITFKGAVAAQESKQIRGLENLEKRLLKAQTRKFEDVSERIRLLQDDLFPRQSLQERQMNFSEFYIEHGNTFIPNLIENLQPLKGEFYVLIIEI